MGVLNFGCYDVFGCTTVTKMPSFQLFWNCIKRPDFVAAYLLCQRFDRNDTYITRKHKSCALTGMFQISATPLSFYFINGFIRRTFEIFKKIWLEVWPLGTTSEFFFSIGNINIMVKSNFTIINWLLNHFCGVKRINPGPALQECLVLLTPRSHNINPYKFICAENFIVDNCWQGSQLPF